MATNKEPLADLANAILDGTRIDWSAAEADVTNRPLLEKLKLVAAVAQFHRESVTAPIQPGILTQWGHLRIVERIGRGAFGEVYRAWDTRLDREVALKLLPASPDDDDQKAMSIIREGRLLARVRHPNVVTIYDAERIGDRIGFWMELVKGRTLEQVLKDRRSLSAAETIKIGIELSSAVAAVHAAGLLHRDIKAHNVMLAEDGRVVLMDFGSGLDGDERPASIAGTPLYLAPELLDGRAATIQSDIYSLGVLLHHLLTGSYPVLGSDLRELRRAHQHRDIKDVRTTRPDLPGKLARTIRRAIDFQPERRHHSADTLAADLASIHARPRLRVASVLGLAAVVTVMVWLAWDVRGRRIDDRVSAGALPDPADTARTRIVAINREPGTKTHPALSPDGNQIAFVWNRSQGPELHVQSTDGTASRPITMDDVEFPSWSPDSESLAVIKRLSNEKNYTGDAIVTMSINGDTSRTLLQRQHVFAGTGLDWSLDGADVVAAGRTSPADPWRLMIVSIATGEVRWITAPPATSVGDSYPVYSPDGASIAFVRDTGSERGLFVLDLSRGEARRVVTASSDISRPAWSADGRSLVYSTHQYAAANSGNSLWRISSSGGEPERVSATGDGASHPSTARRGDRLAFVQTRMDQNLYLAHLSGGASGRVVALAGTSQQDSSPDLSPDGSRIAFASDRSGHSEIWTMSVDGTNARPVTRLGTHARRPRWSPDGRQIAFDGRASASVQTDIFVADAAGGVTRRLTNDVSQDTWASWSANGERIYYLKFRAGAPEIWRVDVSGRSPEQITHDRGLKAQESHDGRFLYYANSAREIWRIPLGGGRRRKILTLPDRTTWGGHWVATSTGLYWLNMDARSRPAIEFLDFATAQVTRAVTPLGIFDLGSGFAVSRDDRWLVYAQRDYLGSDLVMLESVAR